ncbi:MAG: hypothetical protein IT375_36720 [Polyangiaceae bacterium]|nr:hypothetical protein [Polyangiaceae bacterium]
MAPWRVLVAVLMLLVPLRASADPAPSDRAAAEALFRDAKQLFAKKQYAEACRKLEESQRLDPQGGTLLNLAVCHAREGRTASAWVEFQEAMELAKQAKRGDRVRLAGKELAELEKKLARLTIDVPSEARVRGLTIQRGGESVGEGAWGTAVPVDPGVAVAISASASGYRTWRTEVRVSPAEQKTLVVPKLEKLPAPPPPPPGDRDPKGEKGSDGGDSSRIVVYVAGGVGVVALGVGGYFGLRALSKKNAAEEHCDGQKCSQEGLDLNDEADRSATVSNIGFGVGLVAIGVGAYFHLTQPTAKERPAPAKSAKVRLVPSIGARSSGILLSGRW